MFSRSIRTASFVLVAAVFSGSPLLRAQPLQKTPQLPDGGAREQLVSIFIPSLPNAPFTATLSTEWDRTYSDGTTITLKSRRLIARDKSGRIFQERRLLVPEDGQSESAIMRTEISDPQQHVVYFCFERERECQLRDFAAVGPMGPAGGSFEPKGGAAEMHEMGEQNIAGVETKGWQGSVVIPARTIGNDSPILTKREYWYSSKLGFNLRSIRQDPRFGVEKFEVTELTLGEPDPKLFEPTNGFAIVDTRRTAQGKPAEPSN